MIPPTSRKSPPALATLLFAPPLPTRRDLAGDQILLNREGLLQVDRLLHEFFKPEHRNARYA